MDVAAAIAVGHQGPRDTGDCVSKRREFLLFKHSMQTLEGDPSRKGPIAFDGFQFVQQVFNNLVHGGARIATLCHHQARSRVLQFAPAIIP